MSGKITLCRFALFLVCLVSAFPAMAETSLVTNLPATTLPDTGTSILRVFGALILVISLFLGGVWLTKNWQRLAIKKGTASKLNVIEVRSLGQRQAIYVVGYQQQRLLLASSPSGITLVSHLPAAEETESETEAQPNGNGRMSFAEAFQQVLNRKK